MALDYRVTGPWAEPEVDKLMDECQDKNMIDKDEYPQTAEIEKRCVNILSRLYHSPEKGDGCGCSTIGGYKPSSSAIPLALAN